MCGYVMADMDLSIREWDYRDCSSLRDREVNAALNLKDIIPEILRKLRPVEIAL